MATETVHPPDTNGRGSGSDSGRTEAERQNSRAWHEWLAVGVGIAGLLAIAAIIISVVALSSKNPTTGPKTVTIQAASATPAVAPLSVKMFAKADDQHGRKGPDGKWHDAIQGGNMTIKAGQTVTVTVYNYDTAPHSYTAPDLGLNVKLNAGTDKAPTITKFTFKAPAKPGTYQWFCGYPCDPWAMAHDGYMRGHVTVTA